MTSNIENIVYNDFANICRTCLLNCDIKFPQDNLIIEVFYKLTGIQFETNDDLPKQICRNCFEKMNEIHEFALRCKQTHSRLIKSLNKFKMLQLNKKLHKRKPIEVIKIKEERTIEEVTNNYFDESSSTNENVINQSDIKTQNEEMNSNEDSSNCSINSETTNNRIKDFKYNIYKTNQGEPNHSGERPYTCDICLKAFSKTSTLSNHMATHSSERPFECDLCGKTFILPSRLKHHKKVHSFIRPYQCDVCNKTFKCSSNLIRHKRVHSGERPHKCDVCNQSFTALSNLKRHNKVHD